MLTNSTDLILCSQRQPRVCRSKSGWSGEGREVQFCQFEHLRAYISKTDNGCVVGPGETTITKSEHGGRVGGGRETQFCKFEHANLGFAKLRLVGGQEGTGLQIRALVCLNLQNAGW